METIPYDIFWGVGVGGEIELLCAKRAEFCMDFLKNQN